MPGTDGTPDEIDTLINGLTNEGSAEGQSSADSQSLPSALQPSSHGDSQQQRLFGGKYQKIEDFEKAHKSLRGEFDKRSTKLNSLESILNNPQFRQIASSDPQMRDALAKAGYNLAAEEEAQAAEDSGDVEWDGDESHPAFVRQYVDNRFRIMEERSDLQEKIGRKLTSEEWSEIKQIYVDVEGVNVRQAWMLSDSYQKHLKLAEDKRFESTQKRTATNRPRPPSQLMAGQKPLDLKKDPTQMNDQERRAFIMKQIEDNQ